MVAVAVNTAEDTPKVRGTEATVDLCERIALRCKGACILGFSRGKDSIAAWLWLRQFFDRIIPFHCASVPHLQFVDESLDYYEDWFDTPIERCASGDMTKALGSLYYQTPDALDGIWDIRMPSFDNHDVVAVMRKKYSVPNAWCAFGINMSDSIDRRIYVKKYQGKIDHWRSFYPCFDWSRKQILEIVRESGIKLPKDYLMANRTLAGVPGIRHMERMKEVCPNDYERVKEYYPLIESQLARNEFRSMSAKSASATENSPGIPRTENGTVSG